MIVHLNGWPAAGKFTVGRHLARRLDARFIHNHLLHDVAICCAGLNDPARWPLYEAVRSAACEVLAQRPTSERFVMTNALVADNARDAAQWQHVVDLAKTRCAVLVPVLLEIASDENERRLLSTERREKLKDPRVLSSIRSTCTMLKPALPHALEVDVTHLSPEEAAAVIFDHVAPIARGAGCGGGGE